MDILFADDVMQVIQNWRNNRSELAEDTAREIKRISDYEKKWKIKTNINKFNILSISKLKPDPIIVEGRRINFANESKILGLTLKRTGIMQHVTNRIKLAKAQSTKMKRFIRLKESTKLHLYKALIRPLMEYPIIPTGLTAASNN